MEILGGVGPVLWLGNAELGEDETEGVALSPSASVPPPRSLDRLIWSPHCQSESGGGVPR